MATAQPSSPANGFLNIEEAAAAASEPMLSQPEQPLQPKVRVNDMPAAGPAAAVDKRPMTESSSAASSRGHKFTVIQRLVLLILLALVVVLCSVFIRPEIYFSNYGK